MRALKSRRLAWPLTVVVPWCAGALLLTACPASTPKKPTRKPMQTVPLDGGPWGEGLAPEVKRYLDAVHAKVNRGWTEGVIRQADHWLAADAPANNPRLRATVDAVLGPDGKLREVRLHSASGLEAFDASAVRVMREATPYPALPPSLREKHVTLRWSLHRDGRLAHPRHAELLATPMTPQRAFRLALDRHDFARAQALLGDGARGARTTMHGVLAERALASLKDPAMRAKAFQLASTRQLERLLWSTRDRKLWDRILAELLARKATMPLQKTLAAAGVPAGKEGQRRVAALLGALVKLGHRLPPEMLAKLIAAKPARVVAAAAALVTDAEQLRRAIAARRATPAAGPLAVALRRLGKDPEATAAIRDALASRAAPATLAALCQHKLVDLADEVAKIIRSRRPTPVRIKAIKTIGCLDSGLARLYGALRSKDPAIQLAAIGALGGAKNAGRGASYRLADVAYRDKGPARVAALAALARLKDDAFTANVLRRARRLGPADQLLVVPALASYGDKAVGTLTTVGKTAAQDPALLAAVTAALRKIGSDGARQALAELGQGAASQPAASLEGLLAFALRSLPPR